MSGTKQTVTPIARGLATMHSNYRLAVILTVALLAIQPAHAAEPSNHRPAAGDDDLRYWLDNMVRYHRYSLAEVESATGMSQPEIAAAIDRFGLQAVGAPRRKPGDPLVVLPYPGGRHPRIGFLEGAIRPQRETKISVFAPWVEGGYVVVDVPEAIWSNLGLTYLAHTHVPTVWTRQNIELERLEWNRRADGTLDFERTLPDGMRFGTRVTPGRAAVTMEMWLTNGTAETLTDLRVQNCVMLKSAAGFEQQTNDNKIFSPPYAVCRSSGGDRWVITAWVPCHRAWGNAPCPCLHADPKFPDCAPGETRRIKGWLSFYEGQDLDGELARVDATGWRE